MRFWSDPPDSNERTVRCERSAGHRGCLFVTYAFRLSGERRLGNRDVLCITAHSAEGRLHTKNGGTAFETIGVPPPPTAPPEKSLPNTSGNPRIKWRNT